MEIYVYTPQGFATGGIELLHQLCCELNTYNGINAYIWHERSVTIPETYKKYGNSGVVADLPPKGSVLIFPESWAKMLNEDRFKDYTKVLFWESVHWYERWIPREQYLKFPEGTIHLAQSWYAYTWLKEKTGIDAIMVTDYLNDEYMSADLSKPRKRQILYNPTKGFEFTKKIMAKMPNETFIPIQNMTVSEVKNLMEESMLYIDFGNHPGKDRMPREAAMCGCCVITSTEGSANFTGDVFIDCRYKIPRKDENLDRIVVETLSVLDLYESHTNSFDFYRGLIRQEKAEFQKGVAELVNRLKM